MKTLQKEAGTAAANGLRVDRTAISGGPSTTRHYFCSVLCGLLVVLAIPAHALKPDTTFGTDGLADVHAERDQTIGESLNDVLVDTQGRYVAAGEETRITPSNKAGLLVRRMPDGSPDLSFAGIGHAYLVWQGFGVDILSVAEQPEDGKLVVGGNLYPSDPEASFDANWLSQPAVVCRFHSEGELDLQFGNEGCFRLADIGGRSVMGNAVGLALQGNHIVVLGHARDDANDPRSFVLARLAPNGFPDFSFGDPNIGGSVCPATQTPRCGTTLSPAIATDLINPTRLRIDPNDERIVVAGEDAPHEVAYLLRYGRDGDIDKVFPQVDFEVIEGYPGRDIPSDFLVLPDGAIVLVAKVFSYDSNNPGTDIPARFGIAKITPEGIFDKNFSSSGMATYEMGPNNGIELNYGALSIAQQPSGKLLVASSVKSGSWGSTVCRLLRVDAEGMEDPTLVDFGYAGIGDLSALNSEILTNENTENTLLCNVRRVIAENGTVVVVGESVFSTTLDTSAQDAYFYRLEERSLFSDEFESPP